MLNGFYKGAGAKCDHQRIGVRARVRANLDLDCEVRVCDAKNGLNSHLGKSTKDLL